ncbi:uncharacterized protein LOC128397527 [Panonychus citri]|uniref:uncharacterized protein LOC128397527 n=1 Tax=Panonychus citri TaxID=50023 RepID=UPI002307C309|nr:uncharacterized protein LOC128397527 [Panonychus citri]
MESISNGKSVSNLFQFLVVVEIILFNPVNCGNQSLSTTPLSILSSPLPIPSSTLPITTLSSSQLTKLNDKSYVIPVRLKLSKEFNSTKSLLASGSSSSLNLPIESKSNLFRWFPFNRLYKRQGRQTNVQIAVTVTLAITAALSAIILALLIALLISIGSLGYAVKKCSFGFGKYLFKLFGSVDQHSHKFIHIIHLIIRILNEVSGRQHHQTDFLFHLLHIVREVGIERQNQRLLASNEINVNDNGPPQLNGPPPNHHHDLSGYPGFSDSPRSFIERSVRPPFEHGPIPKGYGFPRTFDHSNRDEDTPLSYSNKSSEYEMSRNQNSHPNLQYQSPYYNNIETSRQDSSSAYDSDQHPNHKYN